MKIIKIFIIVIILFSTNACFNYRELDQLAICSAIGLDKKGDNYLATIQIMNTKKNGSDLNSSSEIPQFIIFEIEGKTIHETLRNIVTDSPRKLYADHMQLLVLGEDLAKEGLEDTIDYLFRYSEIRKQFDVIVTQDSSANEVLKTLTPLETLNAKNIVEGIDTSEKYLGTSYKISFEDLVSTYLNSKKDLILPSIVIVDKNETSDKMENIKESDASTKLVLSGMAYFKDDKLIDYFSLEESKFVSFIKNEIKDTILINKCNNKDYFSIEVSNSKTKAEVTNKKIKIEITNTASLTEINCEFNLEKESEIRKLENIVNTNLEEQAKKIIKTLIDKKSDALGLEDNMYKNNLNEYKKIYDWQEFIEGLEIDIKVKTSIIKKGNTLKVVGNER